MIKEGRKEGGLQTFFRISKSMVHAKMDTIDTIDGRIKSHVCLLVIK